MGFGHQFFLLRKKPVDPASFVSVRLMAHIETSVRLSNPASVPAQT